MPHNWASAEFIRLVVHQLALERSNELHVLDSLPPEWTRSGAVTRLNKVATSFGPLTLELKISGDRGSALLTVEPLMDPACTKLVVHLSGLVGGGKTRQLGLDPAKRQVRQLSLNDGPELREIRQP